MANEQPVDVGLGAWKPPTAYPHPDLEHQGRKQPAEIEGPGDTLDSLQFGERAEVYTLHGEAYAKDISVLQMYRGKALTLRHSVYSGKVYIESVEADTTDSWDELTELRMHDGEMQDVTETKQVYVYRVGLVAVDEEGSESELQDSE
jgi:hypothetical protein